MSFSPLSLVSNKKEEMPLNDLPVPIFYRGHHLLLRGIYKRMLFT
jgi:hypothetical protein